VIAIVDTGGANLASLIYAFARLGETAQVTSDASQICGAARVVLPGVGAAADAMHRLRSRTLEECVRDLTQPVLGVCLGMHLLFEGSEEGPSACLGVLPGMVKLLPAKPELTIPHMGWNVIAAQRTGSPLFAGIDADTYFYFVHSYAAPVGSWTLATTSHGATFTAALEYKNFFGTQFHPERSGEAGSRVLKNFLSL
jgi:imidazole glycerol-phosphate synthase subunit HisH